MPGEIQQTRKQQFITLDAMRGVAAIGIVVRHLGAAFHAWEPASFLAVDMFFVLSGFVLAFSYDARFESGMSVMTFMRLRLIRLFPFALIGALLGLAAQLVIASTSMTPVQSIISAVLTSVALPTPFLVAPGIVFPLNTVFWSLFFELWIANFAFAIFWRGLRGPILLLVVFGGAIGLLICERQFHMMDVGWSWGNFYAGFPRVAFSFFAGVAIERLVRRRPSRLQVPSWVCIAVLIAAFCVPLSGSLGNLVNLGIVLFVFPLLVYVASGATEKYPRIGATLGDVSYGVYAIHIPIIAVLAWVVASMFPSHGLSVSVLVGLEISFILFVIALAFVIDAKIDRPLRRRLLAWSASNAAPAKVL